MKFEDALLALAAGRQVRRRHWVGDGKLTCVTRSNGAGVIVWEGQRVGGEYDATAEDRAATNWEIVRDPALSGEPIALVDAEKGPGLIGDVHFEPKRSVTRGLEPCADAAANRARDALRAADKEIDPLAEIHHAFEDLRDKLEPLTGGPGYYAPALEQCWLRLREAEFWARHLMQDADQRHEMERFTTRAARR